VPADNPNKHKTIYVRGAKMTMTNLSKARLIAVPALITLAVTLLRLYGELQDWSPTLFSRKAGGVGAIVGIIWLAPIFGIYFAFKLVKLGAGPATPRRALVHALAGVGVMMAFGLIVFLLWPPYQVQVILGAIVAAVIVMLQLRGWPEFGQLLLFYSLAARLPVVIIMLFTILGSWGTHYDAFPPNFPLTGLWEKWLWGGLTVQLTVWIGNTVLLGALFGSLAAAIILRQQMAKAVA
jgi:hypothetical protein